MVKLNKHRLIDLALTCAIFIILIASAFSAKQDYQYLSSRTAITKGLHFASLARIAVSKNMALSELAVAPNYAESKAPF